MIQVEWIGSFGEEKSLPKRVLPEIAIVGRSNVGKSSLINHLLQRKKLAKVSATPGKTQTINYFLVNDSFFLVDLPGYGYARAPVALQNKWRSLVDGYLHNRKSIKLLLFLVDSRNPPSKEDSLFFHWAAHVSIPVLLILTKTDALKKTEISKRVASMTEYFTSLEPQFAFECIPYSVNETEGRKRLWHKLENSLHSHSDKGEENGIIKT